MQWCADVEPEVGAAFVDTMRIVQMAGGEVVPVTLPELEHLRVAHLMTISSELRQAMKAYTKVRAHALTLSRRDARPGTSGDQCACILPNRDLRMILRPLRIDIRTMQNVCRAKRLQSL